MQKNKKTKKKTEITLKPAYHRKPAGKACRNIRRNDCSWNLENLPVNVITSAVESCISILMSLHHHHHHTFLSSSFLLRCNGKNETDSNALKLHQTLEQVFWEHEFSLMIALNRLFFSGFCANTNYCAIHSNPVFIEKKRRHSVVNSLQVQQKPEKFNRQKKNVNRCFFLIFV